MQHLLNKQPEFIKAIIVQTTATTEWSVFLESCILDKNAEMAELSTDCDAEQFQRKYLVLKAQRLLLNNMLDLMSQIKLERQP